MRIVCCMWEHQIVMCVTIHNSFVLYNCAYCKLQLCTVCDLSATVYVTYIAYSMYRAHSRVYTLRCGLVGSIMEVPKLQGREAGLSMEAIGIKVDQAVLYTKCPLLPYPPTPKCTPAMSLMCEGMKTGRKLVICWDVLPEG